MWTGSLGWNLVLTITGGLLGAVALVLLYGIFIERYLVCFPRYRIAVPGLPEAFRGTTIVHISDAHLSALVPGWFLKRLFGKVAAIEKDLIVTTGDNVLGREVPERVAAAWELLGTLEAPQGVYSVLGNCDHRGDDALSKRLLAESGQDVRGRAVAIEKNGQRLWIAGAGDFLEDHIPLDEVLKDVPQDDFRIVLAHNPDTADTEFSSRVDLLLAGHTHGGQLELPLIGIPMLPVKNKNYSYGLKTSRKGFPVFISKGIGWGVFPGRLNCLPEIPILELVPATG
jgi:predicted MPP superfamily phosphohydrolase